MNTLTGNSLASVYPQFLHTGVGNLTTGFVVRLGDGQGTPLSMTGGAVIVTGAFFANFDSYVRGVQTTGPENGLQIRCYGTNVTSGVEMGALGDINSGGGRMYYNPSSGQIVFDTGTVVNKITRMSISSRIYMNGSASRSFSGYPITTPDDTVSNLRRLGGYVECQTDVGPISLAYNLSDERLKTNIAPVAASSAALIKQIEFIQFNWHADSGATGHVDVGFRAQQLQALDSRLVNVMQDARQTLFLNEPVIVAHMAKAIQELIARVEVLEAAAAATPG